MIKSVLAQGVARFVDKSQDYPPEGYRFLGERGQFSDIARKFFKLKDAVWDGKQLKGEQVDEICEDLIGHLLILLSLRSGL